MVFIKQESVLHDVKNINMFPVELIVIQSSSTKTQDFF